jgi:O-methyltransferase involved in polyketide biosynthesis
MAEPTDLEPTAALVMIWARDLYRTGSAARFYSCLDLTAGEHMRQECETVCPWYGEVILNRKWLIRHLAAGFVAEAPGPCQVVIPAAGRSPLALELLDAWNDGIASVIELDITGMEEKQRLYERAAPAHAGKIRCIPVDLSDRPATAEAIAGAGYNPDIPTVVIVEGISYYLPTAVLSGIVSLFASRNRKNRAVVEYMLPCRLINEGQRKIPRGIWRIINRDCNLERTIAYSPDEMEQVLARAGCDHVVQHSMHEIELARTGANRYFPADPDGWIRIACGRL